MLREARERDETAINGPRSTLFEDGHLRLLTFNLQVGIQTSAYHHYVTRSWQHLLPNPRRQKRLDVMGEVLSKFDVVGLQEVDGGSFRSSRVNQVEYLAAKAGFPHHVQQLNRNLGRIAQHSNGLLSRLVPSQIEEHRLPGAMPGRGAIHARFGEGPDALHIFVAHLALSHRGRVRQLNYLSDNHCATWWSWGISTVPLTNCTLTSVLVRRYRCTRLNPCSVTPPGSRAMRWIISCCRSR